MTHTEPRQSVFRAAFENVVPVVDDGPMAPLHLADNTNMFGTAPAVLEAVRQSSADDATQYPPTSGPLLREALAAYLGVRPNEVVLGTGGDGVIDCAFRAFCEPGDAIAFPDPTFVMARYFAATNNLRPLPVPVRADATTDIEALTGTEAAAVYVCAPNNPTGLQPTVAELRYVLERAHGFVMLDEAYAEFAGATLTSEIAQHGRAIILRTFSKALGLAGMRIGFAVGEASLMQEIEKARGPFAVSNVALRAATAVLTKGLSWVQQCVSASIAARAELIALLRERGFSPLPSAGNFLLVPVRDAKETLRGLAARGISVRPFTRLTVIGDAVRVTVGPGDAMRRVADALREVAG